MDFHSLARRDLQTLCKKNKIPANKTNVAMADALQALQHVEGLEELLNPSESQNPQAMEKPEIGSPEIPKTATRTSTRRKPIKAAEEPESFQTLTRTLRGTRRITEELYQENSQPPQTPAVPSSRKRAPAASARQRSSTEQCSVQHSYGTRRSVRLSEKMGRTDPIHIEFSKTLCKDLDGDEEENNGHDLLTISEERSTITNDSVTVSDKKSDRSENDSKAEFEEIAEVSARPDVKVSEATDEANGDGENKEGLQKNTVEDCEKRAEKGTDISSITMLITKNSNEAVKLEDKHQHMNSDDSCCESEKPDLSLTASGGGVVCKSPAGMDPEKNVANEGAKPDYDEDGQGGSEEFGMGLNQKTTADPFSSGLDTDHSVSADQSEAEVELESAKQGSMDFAQASDDSCCDSEKPDLSFTASGGGVVCKSPVGMDPEKNVAGEGAEPDDDEDGQGGSEEFGLGLNQKTTADPFSSGLDTDHSVSADQSEAEVELESAKQGSMDFEDDASPPSNNQGDGNEVDKDLNQKITDTFSIELGAGFSVTAQSEAQVELAREERMNFEDDFSPLSRYNQGDVEEFDKDLNKETTEIFSSELRTDSSVVDQSEAQIEIKFFKQGNMDFKDDAPPSSNGQGESEEFVKALDQKITDSFFSELDNDFFDADQSEQVKLEFSKQESMDFEDDAEEFEVDLYQKTTDAFSSELGADCSVVDQSEAQVELEFSKQGSMDSEDDAEEFDMDLYQMTTDAFSSELGADCSVVDQSETQVELEFAKDGSIDFEDFASSISITDPKPETQERNVNEINSVEPLPKGDKLRPSSDNFPSPVKIMSPPFLITNAIVSGRTPLSPLATSRSTPTRKSSSNRPSALFSDNKENLDNGKKMMPKTEMVKKTKNNSRRDTAEDIMLKKLNDTSLRQLRKMFKEKLQIKENAHSEDMNVVKEVVKMRPALQTLPENRTADDGTGKEY